MALTKPLMPVWMLMLEVLGETEICIIQRSGVSP